MAIDPDELEQHLADMPDDTFQDLLEKVRPPASSGNLRKGHDLWVAQHPQRQKPDLNSRMG